MGVTLRQTMYEELLLRFETLGVGFEGASSSAFTKWGFAHIYHKLGGTASKPVEPMPVAAMSSVTTLEEPEWGMLLNLAAGGGGMVAPAQLS